MVYKAFICYFIIPKRQVDKMQPSDFFEIEGQRLKFY
jgi:hypothetical protein